MEDLHRVRQGVGPAVLEGRWKDAGRTVEGSVEGLGEP